MLSGLADRLNAPALFTPSPSDSRLFPKILKPNLLYNPESSFHLRSLVAAALELAMIYCCTKYMLQQIHQSYFSNTDPSSWFDVEVWLSCCRRVKGGFFCLFFYMQG